LSDLPADVREKVMHPPAETKETPGGEEKSGGAKE
jgi:hypothetical protein